MSRPIAGVVLVDARGWVLLQERDELAPVNPGRWSLVGGAVEPGETDGEAAVRELAEETGVDGLPLTFVGTVNYVCNDCPEEHDTSVYLAFTDLTDSDIDCREGRQIVFVDPRTIDTLPWAQNLVHSLPLVIGHPAYVERFGRVEPRGFGCVILVDARGWLLLQERDEHAPIDPDRWGLPGGHLEQGEDPKGGACRELEEETGVRLDPGTLQDFATFAVFHPAYGSVDRVHVYVAAADLTDADVDCREGRQIVFVEPGRARHLALTMTGVLAVPAFLDSAAYRGLARLR